MEQDATVVEHDTDKVLPTDKGEIVNEYQTTAYEMMWWDYDKQRRIIIWPGDMIENMIVSALRRTGE